VWGVGCGEVGKWGSEENTVSENTDNRLLELRESCEF